MQLDLHDIMVICTCVQSVQKYTYTECNFEQIHTGVQVSATIGHNLKYLKYIA